VHGTGVYSTRVGPKGSALERFLDIKKKKKGWASRWKKKETNTFSVGNSIVNWSLANKSKIWAKY
jgi:hypothetical protein